ncbi:hypothetical protein BABINDRAFT_160554, partial [Babjeviella inositovora NRRL Y-12698]
IEHSIKLGDKYADEKSFDEAVTAYSAALAENPNAFKALIQRSIAFQKMQKYAEALADLDNALKVAESRGNREQISTAYFRQGLVYFLAGDFEQAVPLLTKGQEYGCTEASLAIWKLKAEKGLSEGKSVKFDGRVEDVAKAIKTAEAPNASVEAMNRLAPVKEKIKIDWYQSTSSVTLTIFAKNIDKDALRVTMAARSLSVNFPTTSSSEYAYELDPLFSSINPEKSTYKVFGTKLELVLVKNEPVKWTTLEADADVAAAQLVTDVNVATHYPTSSKKGTNWASFQVDEEDAKDGGEDFFKTLYKDAS